MGKAQSLQGSESGRGRSIPLFQNGTGIRENGLGGKCLARLKFMWVTELQIILCLCDGVRGMNSTAETRRRRVKRREDIIEGGVGFRREVTSVIVGRNKRRFLTFTDFRLPARAGEGQHRDPEPHDQAGRGADRLSTGDGTAGGDLGQRGGRGRRPGAGRTGAERAGDAGQHPGGVDGGSQPDGTYSMKSVTPGTYKLLVVDEGETHTSTREPSPDDYDERAETVEVRPKETVTRDLKMRPVK